VVCTHQWWPTYTQHPIPTVQQRPNYPNSLTSPLTTTSSSFLQLTITTLAIGHDTHLGISNSTSCCGTVHISCDLNILNVWVWTVQQKGIFPLQFTIPTNTTSSSFLQLTSRLQLYTCVYIQLCCADVSYIEYITCTLYGGSSSCKSVRSPFHRAGTTGAWSWLKRLAAETRLSNAAVTIRETNTERNKILLVINAPTMHRLWSFTASIWSWLARPSHLIASVGV